MRRIKIADWSKGRRVKKIIEGVFRPVHYILPGKVMSFVGPLPQEVGEERGSIVLKIREEWNGN